MERQNFNFKIKALTETGSFLGLAASYNNVDLGNDKILPGAFSRTLTATKQFVLLWQHDPAQPIGTVKCTDTAAGLQVEGQLLLSDATGAKAYNLLKAQVLKGLSIGYDTIQESFENGVRLLKEIRLWEVSIVTFGMNLEATISSVKALSDADRAQHLKSIDTHRKAIDRHQRAMRMSLKALLGDDLDDDDDSSDESPADDPSMLEADEDDQDPADEGMSYVLQELKALALQAGELTNA